MAQSIGHDILVLSNLISRAVDNSPAIRHFENVTGKNTRIISYIAQRGDSDVYQKDLEEHFGITRSTASKVVNLMEKKGLIKRESIPEDARLKKLVLTDMSWDICSRMGAQFMEIEGTLSGGFTEEELEQFFEYVHRMQENIKKRGE